MCGEPPISAPTSVLVKPAGPDCNLRCGYCFYRGKKDLFPAGPHRMTPLVLEQLVQQHLSQSARDVSFCWQGGEPTLMGLPFFERVVALEEQYGRGHVVANSLQTNAMLLDKPWAAFLKKYVFLVGVSLDGDTPVHDANRRDAGDGGSWTKVVENIKMLLDAGVATNVLAVVTEESAGLAEETYHRLQEIGLRHMQFIPIVQPDPATPDGVTRHTVRPEAYGIFLCRLFDRWMLDRTGPRHTSVRAFDALLAHYLGREPPECTMQATCSSYLVVEHNGAVYPCDFFVDQQWELGNLTTTHLARLWRSPRRREFGALKAVLPGQCRDCRWLSVCRGGCPKDRLFGDTPRTSYLCDGYRAFFNHAHDRLARLAAEEEARAARAAGGDPMLHTPPPSRSPTARVGRNAPCPCGSNLKYKRCCGNP